MRVLVLRRVALIENGDMAGLILPPKAASA